MGKKHKGRSSRRRTLKQIEGLEKVKEKHLLKVDKGSKEQKRKVRKEITTYEKEILKRLARLKKKWLFDMFY